jgi:hypothetical protein
VDIVNAVTVLSKAVVRQWDEENDEEIQHALYWRQAYDVRTRELTVWDPPLFQSKSLNVPQMVRTVCRCNSPENPDKKLLGCSAKECMGWMHEQCLMEDALRATYERLGPGKPHLPLESGNKETDSGRVVSAQHSTTAPPECSLPEMPSERRVAGDRVNPSTPNTKGLIRMAMLGQETGELRKKVSEENSKDPKPWTGLFEVSVNAEQKGPPRMEFKDLREDVMGGEKTWTEPVNCLLCGTTVG